MKFNPANTLTQTSTKLNLITVSYALQIEIAMDVLMANKDPNLPSIHLKKQEDFSF